MLALDEKTSRYNNLVLQATRYEMKPRIIEMAATNPFRGVETTHMDISCA
jgi:hypothetical protein